jgi:two-component system CheB/CheR fusion protein
MHPTDAPSRDHVEMLLHLLVDQAREHAIVLLSPAGTVLWCNSSAELVFNTPRASLVGSDLSRIFTSQDRAKGLDELEFLTAANSTVSEDDRWHVRPDGSRFWSSGAMVALRNDAGDIVGYGKILRDRTSGKEQLELMSNAIRELQANNESKDLAITKISHELRNVFAGINMGLQLIRNRKAEAVGVDVEKLMRQQLDVVERLTEDLLDVKRLNSSKVSLSRRDVVLQDVIHDVIMQFRDRCEEKSLDLQSLVPPTPIVVSGDRVRLQQVFSNLFDNAIKYTPASGHIWIKMTVEDEDAVVHVEDDGKGIPPDMLTRIFQLFTQIDPNASSQGLGLGLALVHELMQLHGGSVQAMSKGLALGSKFTVRLPMCNPSGPSTP